MSTPFPLRAVGFACMVLVFAKSPAWAFHSALLLHFVCIAQDLVCPSTPGLPALLLFACTSAHLLLSFPGLACRFGQLEVCPDGLQASLLC